jgi:hypothetical protein
MKDHVLKHAVFEYAARSTSQTWFPACEISSARNVEKLGAKPVRTMFHVTSREERPRYVVRRVLAVCSL